MNTDGPHTHPCRICKARFTCYGNYWYNYDGFPEAVCDAYHENYENECLDCYHEMVRQAEEEA